MDVKRMVADLREELEHINEVILNLERLAMSRERRRGRPPAGLALARKRGRPLGSKNKATSVKRSPSRPLTLAEQPERAMAAGQAGLAAKVDIPA